MWFHCDDEHDLQSRQFPIRTTGVATGVETGVAMGAATGALATAGAVGATLNSGADDDGQQFAATGVQQAEPVDVY